LNWAKTFRLYLIKALYAVPREATAAPTLTPDATATESIAVKVTAKPYRVPAVRTTVKRVRKPKAKAIR
jgi:hypothetical protein